MKSVYLPPSLLENHTEQIYKSVLEKSSNYKVVLAPQNSINLVSPWKNCDLVIPPIIIKESTFWKRLHDIDPKLDNANVCKAYELSKQIHGSQTRDNHRPYFLEHILPVTLYYLISCDLLKINIEEDILISCLLHDCIEDSDGKVYAYKSSENDDDKIILQDHFNKNICDTVTALTKIDMPNRELKLQTYLKQLNTLPSALLIKCIDRILNLASDVEYINTKDPVKPLRYLEETNKYFLDIYKDQNPYFREILQIIMDAIREAVLEVKSIQ